MNLPSICLQKQKNRWKETQQGSQISFICTMPSSWLQPALCMSATTEPTPSILLQAFSSPSITPWLLINREPGTQSWVYCLSSLPHRHIHATPMQMPIHFVYCCRLGLSGVQEIFTHVCQSLSLSEPKRNPAQHTFLGPAWFSP